MQFVFSQESSIRSLTNNGENGIFLPFIYVSVLNGVFVERDTYKQANDTLNSIILNQDARFTECQRGMTSLQTQIRYLSEMNNEYLQLNSVCNKEVKTLVRQNKLLKKTAGLAGIVIAGLILAVIIK